MSLEKEAKDVGVEKREKANHECNPCQNPTESNFSLILQKMSRAVVLNRNDLLFPLLPPHRDIRQGLEVCFHCHKWGLL
jgi:hypothetical protein